MTEFSVMAQLGILLARPGALIAGAPAFGGAFAPMPVRLGLAVVVAILMVPTVPPLAFQSMPGLGVVIVREMAIGLLMALALMATIAILAKSEGLAVGKRMTMAQAWQAISRGLLPLTLPVVLLGAISGRAFFQSNLIVPIVACVVATFLHALVLLLVRSAGGTAISLAPLLRIIMLQTVLNVMIVPPIYLLGSLAQRPVSSRNV